MRGRSSDNRASKKSNNEKNGINGSTARAASASRCTRRAASTPHPSSDGSGRQLVPVDADAKEGICNDPDNAGPRPANPSEDEVAKDLANQTSNARSTATDSVGGLEAAMSAGWTTICFPLECPDISRHLRPSRGIILHGPKGAGKSLIIKALVNVCSQNNPRIAAFVNDKYSDDISDVMLAKLFDAAQRFRPSVIFMDNFDGIGRHGGPRVPALAALMDGLDYCGSVFVIGAIERLDLVDPALRKFGRFDTEVFVDLPDLKARGDILRQMTLTWDLQPSVISEVANGTSGFSRIDLADLCQKAFVTALERAHPNFLKHLVYHDAECQSVDFSAIRVEMEDFKEALNTVQSTSQQLQNDKREYLGLECSTEVAKVDLRRCRAQSKGPRCRAQSKGPRLAYRKEEMPPRALPGT